MGSKRRRFRQHTLYNSVNVNEAVVRGGFEAENVSWVGGKSLRTYVRWDGGGVGFKVGISQLRRQQEVFFLPIILLWIQSFLHGFLSQLHFLSFLELFELRRSKKT